jgi:hypothetical protein
VDNSACDWRRASWLRATVTTLVCALGLGARASSAHAYSSFSDYIRSIQEGGGGGRVFSGTPADGYGCDVCHTGAEGAKLEVLGLPEDGYVPGRAYEITLLWPEAVPHVAIMAELSDTRGQPSGTTALLPYAAWQLGERCENDFPAADLCRVGSDSDGCCRDLEPDRDGCSLPGARNVLWVLDCDSSFARMVWTAPPTAADDVWFSAEMVTSNLQNDAAGDGVTTVQMRIPPNGGSTEIDSAVGDCHAATAHGGSSSVPLVSVCAAVFGAMWRRRKSAVNGPS